MDLSPPFLNGIAVMPWIPGGIHAVLAKPPTSLIVGLLYLPALTFVLRREHA